MIVQRENFDYSAMGIWRQANREDLEYFLQLGIIFKRLWKMAFMCR